MKDKIRALLKIGFVRDFLTLFTGSTLSQLILFLLIPVLSRLYTEEMFGLYFVFMSIAMIFKLMTTLRFELAIVLPDNDKDAINTVVISLLINVIMTTVISIALLFLYDIINSLLGKKNLGIYLYLIPVFTFISGIYVTFNYWSNREKYYKNISGSKVIKSVSVGGWNLAWGYSAFKNIGLIPGQIIGTFLSSLFLVVQSYKRMKLLLKYVSITRMKFLIKKYKEIPIFNTSINVTVTASNEIPLLMLSAFFGVGIVGLYGMGNKLIATPADLVSRSVGQVFFKRATEIYNSGGNIYNFLKKTYLNLLKIALLLFIPAFILTFFLGFILGHDWEDAGTYAGILIPLIFLKFLNNPVSSIFTILNEQRNLFKYYIVVLVMRISAIYIGFKIFNDPVIAVALFVIVGIVFNFTLMILFLRMAKRASKKSLI